MAQNSALLAHSVRNNQKFLSLTKGFTLTDEEQFLEQFRILPPHVRKSICTSSLNFLDYYDYEEIEHYIGILHSVNPQMEKSNSRLLPPSKDILVFSKILEDYFSKDLSEQQYLRWFPVWLWWNLTTIIPLRPSEYCTIERDCLLIKKGNFYLKLPRYKQKLSKKNIQIVDVIKISEELYRKIEDYKLLTNSFGKTDTLISYRSIPSQQNLKKMYIARKLNPDKFTLQIFRDILESFYTYIVFGDYSVSLQTNLEEVTKLEGLAITRKLRAGDTRHLAFVNLHRQGYHAIEIARLGGHTSIASQSHYFNHIESLVDLEILELIQNIDIASYTNKLTNNDTLQGFSIDKEFIERFVLKPPTSDFKRKMADGYCTFELQLCPVSDCWECNEWWRISQEEFIEKQNILAQKVQNKKDELENVIDNLKNLYKGIYAFKKEEFYSSKELQKELVGLSKRMDKTITKYVSLIKIKERIIQNAEEG